MNLQLRNYFKENMQKIMKEVFVREKGEDQTVPSVKGCKAGLYRELVEPSSNTKLQLNAKKGKDLISYKDHALVSISALLKITFGRSNIIVSVTWVFIMQELYCAIPAI